MRSLDAVYDTFTKLEKNYAKSKKTRKEYLLSKFGGDFEIGSFLILTALSGEDISDPEDVAKLSRIRDIFDKIAERKDSLDSLTDFTFEDSSVALDIITALSVGEETGTGLTVVPQSTLYAEHKALHYHVSKHGTYVAPLGIAEYYKCINRGMTAFCSQLADTQLAAGTIVQKQLGERAMVVDAPAFGG